MLERNPNIRAGTLVKHRFRDIFKSCFYFKSNFSELKSIKSIFLEIIPEMVMKSGSIIKSEVNTSIRLSFSHAYLELKISR